MVMLWAETKSFFATSTVWVWILMSPVVTICRVASIATISPVMSISGGGAAGFCAPSSVREISGAGLVDDPSVVVRKLKLALPATAGASLAIGRLLSASA